MAGSSRKGMQNSKFINKQKNGNNIRTERNNLFLLPIIVIIAILPLIVKLYEYSTGFSQFQWYPVNDIYFDFFLYNKQVILIITGSIMMIIMFYNKIINKEKMKLSKIFIPLVIYAMLALLSSLISQYQRFSFAGTFEQFESVFALIAYCIISYYASVFIKSERDIKVVIYALSASVFVIILIGISQLMGHDFYSTEVGWRLISNATYSNSKESFAFTAGLSRVYLSLYNPNYVGFYVVLILPIMLYMIMFVKKIWVKFMYMAFSLGLLFCLYGSKSTAGLVGVAIVIIFMSGLLWRYWIKYYYYIIPVLVIAVIGIILLNNITDNYLRDRIDKITDIKKSSPTLSSIETNDKNITIHYAGNSLKVEFITGENMYFFDFVDQNDNLVTSQFEVVNGPVTITDPRFPGFVFTPMVYEDVVGFDITIDGKNWYFTNQYGDGSYYYLNNYGKFDKIIEAPSAIFTGYEWLATGRGYIWSRTIPLLKNRLLLGSGADTFTLVFPHNDYVNLSNYGFGNEIMTKPHSLYLQIAVQTGVLSLIAFLIFYLFYFVSSIRLYIKCKYDNFYYVIGAAILISTFGYMICGITNDSSITTAPIFWALIGIGIAINKKVKDLMVTSLTTK